MCGFYLPVPARLTSVYANVFVCFKNTPDRLPTVTTRTRYEHTCLFVLQVKEFDTISRLDQWLTTMLLRIKKTIQDDESDLR